MKEELIKKLKERLEKEKGEIERELKKFAQKGKIPGDWEAKFPHFDGEAGSGALERAADEVEEYETLRSIEQSLEVKLKDINLALEKIKKGNYGICENCGAEIEIDRLEAIPEARFCKKCKR
jgi:RNA polymerase-binding transcription factor DksA